MRFIADMMLGRLARWLRLYGYDTLYGVEEDDEIIRVALEEDRVILTRDCGLAERAEKLGGRVILLGSNDLEEQVGELKRRGVTFRELFPPSARCPKCNGPIRRVSKDYVKGKVPESVYERYDEFYVCKNCGQIYWPGRQWREMLKIDKRLRA
ncbi:Mut7-C RNAse domain-containing protein [Palaeococcus ferrophilus]|uniref:Mut7-C RNAse domain-containing protein n=1 Tax=Palaeococcus ferrophilus TaxID=83868 RepID=UPI00064F6BBD|nr:Mut7-C RNAse domain-containing protein [Palaeococcus ferrophilus]